MTEREIHLLQDPKAFGHPIRYARLVQTHTSWVLLTGDYAYKIKKPVDFGFLDYTTLAARRRFCREELRLNQRLSPDMYLGMLAVTKSGRRVSVGGKGRVIDYCLKMREFPQSLIMTERLKQGRVGYAEVDEIARLVARFHAEAAGNREISRFGELNTVKFNWDENFAQTEPFIGRTISRAVYRRVRETVDGFELRHRALFATRVREGRIRECHGDLHSGNIFMGPPIRVFDCIEFNRRFSCCDVTSEVAFFAMDMEYHGRRDLANYFVDRYLSLTDDAGMLRLLDFYKCYRAYVRGKVTGFMLNDPGAGRAARQAATRTARRYFRLARDYAAALDAKPVLILMAGLPGVGKTHLALRLASQLNLFHLRADVIRKELTGVPVGEHRYGTADQGIYRSSISALTYRTMLARARRYLRNGAGVILDATFSFEESRREAAQVAARVGARFLMVECTCPVRTAVARLKRRMRAFSFSDATPEVYYRMRRTFAPLRRSRNALRLDTLTATAKSVKQVEAALLRL